MQEGMSTRPTRTGGILTIHLTLVSPHHSFPQLMDSTHSLHHRTCRCLHKHLSSMGRIKDRCMASNLMVDHIRTTCKGIEQGEHHKDRSKRILKLEKIRHNSRLYQHPHRLNHWRRQISLLRFLVSIVENGATSALIAKHQGYVSYARPQLMLGGIVLNG
jgi:hypothetical protein